MGVYMDRAIFAVPECGELQELPLFLARELDDRAGIRPPPLPHGAVLNRMRQLLAATPRQAVLAASALAIAVPAAALVTAAPWQTAETLPAETALTGTTEINDALEIVATLESRLGYAQNFAIMTRTGIAQNEDATRTARTQATPGETTDPVALLILRNLPDSVTFSSGTPVGKGAWAMAAGDPNQLTMTLGDGFDKQVNAEVEMISHAGVSLGAIRLALRKDGAAPATAEAVSETPDASAEADEAGPAKPAKRTRHARTRSPEKIAAAETPHKKRAKQVDQSAKAETTGKTTGHTTGTPDDTDSKDPPDTIAKAETPEKKPGPLSKLFSWLTGGASGGGTGTADVARDPSAAMFPQ